MKAHTETHPVKNATTEPIARYKMAKINLEKKSSSSLKKISLTGVTKNPKNQEKYSRFPTANGRWGTEAATPAVPHKGNATNAADNKVRLLVVIG